MIGQVFAQRSSGSSLWDRPPPEWALVGTGAARLRQKDLAQR
jgi:hypothetical protein